MPRKASPFWWRDGWYTDAGGSRQLLALGRGARKAAQDRLDVILLEQKKARAAGRRACEPKIRLKQLIDKFGMSLASSPPDTVRYYRDYLRYLVRQFGNCQARAVTRQQVYSWKERLLARYKANTVVHVLKTARRLYNWALDAEILATPNPFSRIGLPPQEFNRRLVTLQEWNSLYEHAIHTPIRDVLVAMRFTPARPADIRRLDWSMIDWERKLWILPTHKTSRTSRRKLPRVIAFPPVVEEILLRRRQQTGDLPGPVFTSITGKRWNRINIHRDFSRSREAAGLGVADANGEKLMLYSSRHTLLTEAVRAGVTGPQLQLLGGWSSLQMAARYVHLHENDLYHIALRAAGAIASATAPREERPHGT